MLGMSHVNFDVIFVWLWQDGPYRGDQHHCSSSMTPRSQGNYSGGVSPQQVRIRGDKAVS